MPSTISGLAGQPLPMVVFVSALAVIMAAAIAGLVAYVGHAVARENSRLQALTTTSAARLGASLTANVKLAEMRQAWIDALRDNMARYQSMAINPGQTPQPEGEFCRLHANIRLLMNPRDPDYTRLCDELTKLSILQRINPVDFGQVDAYIDVCHSILKREWDVLKGAIGLFSDQAGWDAPVTPLPATAPAMPSATPPVTPQMLPWYIRLR